MEQRMNGSERDVSLAQDLAASAGGVESVAARRGLRAWARRALRERRKGTVLLFALGVLALLAVIMLVYFSLGRADRSASVALAERSNTSEVGRDVAGYILDVVSRSTTATYVEGRTLDNRLVLRRKGFDIPWTAWSNNSVLNIPTTGNTTTMWSALNWNSVAPVWQDREGFDPAGTGLSGGSPWLASTEPTYLDFNRDLYSGNLLAGDFGAGDIQQDRNPWVAHRDWMHISNIAPTGRFVNLYELRPRLGQAANVNWTVGFDVRPRDMSRRLSLLDSVNGSVVNPSFETDFEQPVGTANNANLYSTTVGLNVHRPAFWSNRQVGAFRPTAMPTPSNDANYDPFYAPYQWADADGDGFFDSRWQELIDDRGTNGEILSRVLADTRFRYFVATRIVDLSALINVNTAGDLLARASVTPDAAQDEGLNSPDLTGDIDRNEDNLLYETVGQSPTIGATPADIDLRRLLTARDVTEMTLALSATQVQDNSEYYIGIPRDQSDPNYEASDALRMRGAGLLAYESLARTVSGAAAPSFETALDGGVRENDLFRRFRGLERTTSNPDEVTAYDIQARARWFSLATGDAGLMAGEPVRPRFDAHDLQELLTRRMVNDSERLSGLETVLGGRLGVSSNANAVSVSGPRIENLSPVRENRSTTGELDRTNIDRSYKLALTDLRQRLTTLSGARPIRSAARVVTPAANPTDAQVAILRRSMERLVDADAMSNVEWRRAANAAQTPFMVQIQGFMVDKIDALRRGTDVAVDAQAALWTVAAQSGRVGRPSGRSDLPNFAIPDFVNGGFVGRFTDAQAEAYEALTAKEIADNANIFDNYRDDLRFVPPTRSILGSAYIDPRIAGFVLDTLPANGNRPEHANPYFLVNPIFRAYANMLLPFSDERDASGGTAWNRQRAAADPLRTLSYGQSATNYSQARSANGVGTSNGEQRPVRGPEFALRLAGMLTVNAMDMWDNDGLGIPGSGNIDPNNPYGRAGVGPNDGVVPFPPDARESPDNLSNANRAQNQEPFASRWPLTTAYTLLIDADIRDPQRHHQLRQGSQIRTGGGSTAGDIDNTGRNAWPFYRAIIDASSLNQAVDPTTNARRTPGGKVQPRLLLENTTQNLFNGSADLEVADVDRVPGYSTKLDLDEVRGRDRSSGESNNWALASSARDGINVTNPDRSQWGLSARAINVFGIEAQPVITEVATFVVYADWTAFAGVAGDDEFRSGAAGVTINGDLSPTNPDMLAKSLVVQIANPFDHPIRLDLFQFQMGTPTRVASGGVTRAEYFGPRFAFPAGEELAPGESKNYIYVVLGVNGATAGVDAYLRATSRVGAIAGNLVPTWTDGSDRFMPENITTFTTSDQGGTIQWPGSDARFGNTVAAPTTALLWKLVKQDDPSTTVRDEFWMLADRLRDPMTARRDPSGASELNAGRATWGRRIPTGQRVVGNTVVTPDPLDPDIISTDPSLPNDNTGYTMLLWGSVRRPPQEVFNDGNNQPAIWASAADGVPAWAVETRTVPEPAAALNLDQPRQLSRNIALCDGQAVDDLASLDKAMFTPSAPINNAATGNGTQAGWQQLFASAGPLVGGMIFDSRFPGETGNGLIQPGFNLSIEQTALNKGQPSNTTYTQLAQLRRMPPTRLLLPLFNNRAFSVGPTSSRLRVTDMLLPLAVSPYQDPEARIIASGAGTFDVVEEAVDREWTTTTEAFAMSLPYDRRRDPRYASVGSSDVYNPIDPQVGTSPTTPGREEKLDDYHPQADRGFPGDIMEDVGSALDRGRLKLDAFVPFIDRGNGSSQGADGVFNVATAASVNVSDEVRGLGIPMALTVFEQFRTLRREGLGDAGANAPPAPYRFARPRRAQGLALLPAGLDGPAGSLTRAVPGLVNLNTASLPVLRALPLLSPSDWASGAEGLIEWPLRGTSEYPTQPGQLPDVAATLMAYRDLTPVRLRTSSAPSIWAGPRAGFADFAPTDDWSNSDNRETNVLLSATDARERTAGVAGLIDQPGLRSIGEAGLARMVRDTGTASGRNYAFERNANNIDHLGQLAEPRDANEFNNADQGQQQDAFGFPRENSVARFDRDPGSSSALFRTNSTTASTMPRRAATLTRGSYLDKLETLAALSNVTSVRSDVFAAWFVVQGYQRGDVERIRSPLDPLVPSFQKRYLMIFDRSNVTQAGQRPRVILFREVPM